MQDLAGEHRYLVITPPWLEECGLCKIWLVSTVT